MRSLRRYGAFIISLFLAFPVYGLRLFTGNFRYRNFLAFSNAFVCEYWELFAGDKSNEFFQRVGEYNVYSLYVHGVANQFLRIGFLRVCAI